ncbi:MAG: hypothetical protein HQL06_07220 [Nitrospirae bacterium]|nr:hypothetical protein [Nitrospirota bacterium]
MADAIKSERILAVEGKDEKNFFEALLKYLNIEGCEIRDVGGKYKFKKNLKGLTKTTGFKRLRYIAIIRDADESADSAFQSIVNILKELKLPTPAKMNQFTTASPTDGMPAVGIYIMPGNSETGMLEDLCLKTVYDNPALKCVERFIDCCSTTLSEQPKIVAKAKAQAFLSAMPDIVKSVGEGAAKGYWNFESDVLTDLKDFLQNLKLTM